MDGVEKKAGVRSVRTLGELKGHLIIKEVQGALYSLFHHTNIKALAHIAAGKGIRLSRMDQMNDGTETFCNADRTYAFCLSAVPTENVGMWIAYGVPRKDAIRVRLSGKALSNLCKAKDGRVWVRPVKGKNDLGEPVVGSISLQYVGYVSRSGTRVHVRDVIYRFSNEKRMPRAEVMNGLGSFIKLLGWQYEHEIRLVVTLDKAIDTKKIDLNIPDVIEQMLTYHPKRRKDSPGMPSVIVGPWGCRTAFLEEFKRHINELKCQDRSDIRSFLNAAVIENGIVRESEFKGKIRLGRCADCDTRRGCTCAYGELV